MSDSWNLKYYRIAAQIQVVLALIVALLFKPEIGIIMALGGVTSALLALSYR